MSNYTFIVHAPRLTKRVDGWLERWAERGDVATFPLERNRLVLISREVDRSIRGQEFFRGTAVSPENKALVFGVNGWRDAPAALRANPGAAVGEYITADWASGKLRVDSDVFGGVRTAYTQGSGFIATSDSLLVLMSLRKELGLRNRLDREVATARTARNAVAGQQISPDTLISEISYLPAGRGLRQTGPILGWALTGSSIAEVLDGQLTGRDALREAASNVSSTVMALATVPGWHTRLSLSGGQDSRVVLAALLAGERTRDFSIFTAPRTASTASDYDIVMSLVERFNLEVKAGNPAVSAPDRNAPLTLWGASILGLYDGFGPTIAHRSLIRTFALTGIGAEIYKGNWDWMDLASLAAKAAEEGDVRDALSSQLKKSARSVRVDPKAKNASELVYLGYRNGIHGSAGHVAIHMTGVNPVMQVPLAAAAHTRVSGGFAGRPSGMTDLTLLMSPELAVEPHEDSKRDITPVQAEERLIELGGPLTPPEPLRVYGAPDDIPDGASGLSLNISRSLGFIGAVTTENAMADADEAVAAISDPSLRVLYAEMLKNARWRLDRANGELRAAGTQPPRLRSLAMLKLVDN